MLYSKMTFTFLVSVLSATMASAAPSADEVAQLGKTLTAFGAIKAGNKEGTIPEYTGGICTPPSGYSPKRGIEAGGAPYINPFAAEKPLFKITAENMAQYGDKLDEGTKELLKRYPKTFYLAIYPTHRTACFPQFAYENTINRVMNPKIVWTNGVPGLTGAHAQIPFPIPRDGVEAMWNTFMKVEQPYTQFEGTNFFVDSSGNVIDQATSTIYNQNLYWDNSLSAVPENKPYWMLIPKFNGPASLVGSMQMLHYFLRPDLKGAPAWSYIPGQRRVRLAPEFTYDGVNVNAAGLTLWDEINGFSGNMDRFDFKLLGRKEMYVPYNDYDYTQAPKSANTPNHVDPAVLRFELHRVWIVEATLKAGERHVQKRKVFYIDEDSWNMMTYVGFDQADKPHHFVYQSNLQLYDKPELRNGNAISYDFSRGAYLSLAKYMGETLPGAPELYGNIKVKPYPPNFFTPEALAGMGMR